MAKDTTPSPEEDEHVPEGEDYVSDRNFSDFPISPEVLEGITDLGYVTATPVQSNTIEAALAGTDMLVRAKTGTGKTAAFCVPIVERAEAGTRKPQAVILAPTRELAQQIGEECRSIAKFKDVNLAVLVGGLAMGPQEKQLSKGAELIVGTPGRILDHIRRKNLDLSNASMVCLDEADEMLSMGFYEDVSRILDATADGRQVLLFSATISDETQRLADNYLKTPEDIRLSTDADNVDNIEHVFYETIPDLHKIRALLYLIDLEDPASAIIFCNTREDTATVASFLDKQGLDVQLLSGELSQGRRSQVMKKVKAGEVRFLVATDVAARGIDISDLSHVINYSLPQDPSVYLHRTGRTGRIGKQGTAISLVGGMDLATRNALENRHGLKFTLKELPDADTAVKHRVERQAEQIRSAMGSLVFESYLPTVRALRERPDGDALLAAALRAFFQWDRQRRAEMGEVDSIGELIQQRNEKLDRKTRRDRGERKGKRPRRAREEGRRDEQRGERRRGEQRGERRRDEQRGERRRDEQRGEQRGERRRGEQRGAHKPPRDELDDLDALLVSEDEAPPKKRKRRKKAPSSEAPPSTPVPDLDDLDALLTAE
ncbi:MAG TPA: DEAD/DEAH box helicase [Deltaproteobacteria bacterium]|nr:DEAD/DEAH box helicase [Deltaproteobacteria bacterium]